MTENTSINRGALNGTFGGEGEWVILKIYIYKCIKHTYTKKKFMHTITAENSSRTFGEPKKKTRVTRREKSSKQNSQRVRKIMIPNHPAHPKKSNGPPLRSAVVQTRSVFHVAIIYFILILLV